MNEETGALIDEYAALDAAIEAMRPHEMRHKAIREELSKRRGLDKAPATDVVTFSNDKHTLTWGPRENQRRIVDLAKVKKHLGLPLFMKLVSMTLKNLDAHVTEVDQAKLGLTVTERTGPRSCTVSTKSPTLPVVNQAP